MGVNKSITIEGSSFQFEVKLKGGVMHVSLYSGAESKEVFEALAIVRGWVNPRGNRPFTDQELKF